MQLFGRRLASRAIAGRSPAGANFVWTGWPNAARARPARDRRRPLCLSRCGGVPVPRPERARALRPCRSPAASSRACPVIDPRGTSVTLSHFCPTAAGCSKTTVPSTIDPTRRRFRRTASTRARCASGAAAAAAARHADGLGQLVGVGAAGRRDARRLRSAGRRGARLRPGGGAGCAPGGRTTARSSIGCAWRLRVRRRTGREARRRRPR